MPKIRVPMSRGRTRRGKSRSTIGEISSAMRGNNSINDLDRPTKNLIGRRYSRAFVDFFEDQLVLKGYSWQKVIEEYLYAGPKPLFNALICGRKVSLLAWQCLPRILTDVSPSRSSPHPPRLCLRTFQPRCCHGGSGDGRRMLQPIT